MPINGRSWPLGALAAVTLIASAADPGCEVPGDKVHWIADYCMAKLGTDDEIAAGDCINEELTRRFASDCAAKLHYKKQMCEAAVQRGDFKGGVQACLADRSFAGPTVSNGGVGG